MVKNESKKFKLTFEGKEYKCVASEYRNSYKRAVDIKVVESNSSFLLCSFCWFSYLDGYEVYADKSASELIDLAIARLEVENQEGKLKDFWEVMGVFIVMNGSGKEFERWA